MKFVNCTFVIYRSVIMQQTEHTSYFYTVDDITSVLSDVFHMKKCPTFL